MTKKLMEKKDEEEDSGEKSHRHLRGKKNLFAGGKKTATADSGCCN